jgi:uncharacterized protein YegP (UPF0339 family)
MEFWFVAAVAETGEWTMQLLAEDGEVLLELPFDSRADCEQAIQMIRESPIRYVRATTPAVSGSARSQVPAVTLGFHVSKAPFGGVTVAVYDADLEDQVVLERAAGTWPELDQLAAEYGVPAERISVDEDARANLDAA